MNTQFKLLETNQEQDETKVISCEENFNVNIW